MARAPKGCQQAGCPNRQPCKAHPRGWRASKREMPAGWGTTVRIVKAKFGGRCTSCGAPGTDVDHVIAHADGGGDGLDNLTLLCKTCHKAKTYEENRRRRKR